MTLKIFLSFKLTDAGEVASGFCRVLPACRSSSEPSYDPLIKLSQARQGISYVVDWLALLCWRGSVEHDDLDALSF